MTAPDPSPRGLAETPVRADGTPESTWQEWLHAQGPWPSFTPDVERLVVVGAHPDDEVLGAGGIMTTAAADGVDVVIVCMSDGGGSHPGSPTFTPEELADRRHLELDAATGLLGLDRPRWFGLSDGALADQHHTMAGIIGTVLDERPDVPTGLLSVWSHDGHPDHDAVGRCAAEVADKRSLPIWMYPIWMWHWAIPGDPAIPWDRMHAHRPDAAVLAVKHAAINAFDTQVRPLSADPADEVVLPPHVLAHLTRPWEYVFT
ncbi:PIG-L deacetylase family protein [Gordonia insulae]|uniref:Putative N-acetyl-alpha-D-glucosaminyl L-malate deacetylase 2 n=1 Tax=Gordonia insulae TaxID=2420509 RepID=A0A3G8JP51_9ACTN|nr:PIG-L family deacetylase [Gordonia insulae]AZG46861.1 putative N-acetyl-alpha-D-glucosaminyl L-malate deacetylase 2 [Gordonia insulae]